MNDLERLLPPAPERVAQRARRMFRRVNDARGLESAASSHESKGSRIGPPDQTDSMLLARQLSSSAPPGSAFSAPAGATSPAAKLLADDLVGRANRVMERLEAGESDKALNALDLSAFEAVLRTRGRPALRVVEGDFLEPIDDVRHPESGFWRMFVDKFEQHLMTATTAAGAVLVTDRMVGVSWVQGTAWLVREDRAITNRHVLFPPLGGTRLARRRPDVITRAKIKSDFDVVVDLAFDDGKPRPRRYLVQEVLFVAQEQDPIDIAVLKVARDPNFAGTIPKPLAVAADLEPERLFVVGHPGKMDVVPDDVQAVFGTPNERKRVSFGERMDADLSRPSEIIHDASTIGGYSGGCVLGFGSPAVVGLHYFGDPVNGNRALSAAMLLQHEVAAFLTGGI